MIKPKQTLLALSLWGAMAVSAFAQGTAFTYQGQLNSGGALASGTYDLSFTLYTNSSGGLAIAGPVTSSAVKVTNGLFTATVDFGYAYTGASNWLELAVRTNGASSFSPALTPRQQLTPTPYAVYAESANASNLVGTIQAANLSGAALLAGGNAFTGVQTVTGGNSSGGAPSLIISGPGGPEVSYTSTTGGLGWDLYADNNGYSISRHGIDFPFKIDGASGNSLFSHNVGIGTNAPESALSVVGDEDISGGIFVDSTGINDGAVNGQPSLRFGVKNSNPGEGIASKRTPGGNQFGLDFYTGYADRLSIMNNGFVGIGTTNAANLLDVQGSADFTGNVGIGTVSPMGTLELHNEGGRNLVMSGPGGAEFSFYDGPADAFGWDISANLDAFAISDSGVGYPFTILSPSGNVGIGTTTPTTTLAVNGNIFFGTERNNQVFNQIGDTIYLGAEQKYLGNTLLSAVGGSTDWINLMANPISAGIMFGTSGSSTSDPHSNVTALVVIKPSGNVGIGTATPNSDSQLQVNGMVRMGSETGTSEAPNRPIMLRRINSTSSATGQVVATGLTHTGNTMTLERDGSNGGLVIKLSGTNFNGGGVQISGYGITASGAYVGVNIPSLSNNSTNQVFTDAQRICNCRLSFGEPFNDSDVTTVELMRYVDTGLNNDNYWAGTVTSTVNQ